MRAAVWVVVWVGVWAGVVQGWAGGSCNRTRQVLTARYGVISDGPSKYHEASHCQWLIQADTPGQHITLNITQLETECSYDHLYVHDGQTFDAPLLGVFSGNTAPAPLTASSGAMLIMLYSDTNYALDGFEAEYFVTDCPLNCSGRGECHAGQCQCEELYTGPGCQYEHCPDNCGSVLNRGHCTKLQHLPNEPRPAPYCTCDDGYYGDGCSLWEGDTEGGAWHWLWRGAGPGVPRTSHAGVYLAHLDRLYLYGGYDLNRVLGDLAIFDLKESVWVNSSDPAGQRLLGRRMNARQAAKLRAPPLTRFQNLTFSVSGNNTVRMRMKRMIRPGEEEEEDVGGRGSSGHQHPSPGPRYGHAMERYGHHFVLFGGKKASGQVSDELWLYNTTEEFWHLISPLNTPDTSATHPPGLMHPTLTLVEDTWIYLFGGSLAHGEFSSRMYRLDLAGQRVWERVLVHGGNEFEVRLVGHSTVYHAPSRSLLVFGGIRVDIARFSKLSDHLLVFDLDRQFWSRIHYPRPRGKNADKHIPLERAFHSAVIAGTYMVVMGGYIHKHKEEERCYDEHLYLYHLSCHVWVAHKLSPSPAAAAAATPLTPPEPHSPGQYPRPQGVYGHSLSLRGGNTLLVAGGFHGSVNTQVLAYVLPSTLVSPTGKHFDTDEACRRHTSQEWCAASLGCGWCPSDKTCYERSRGANCTNNLQTYDCPGLCPGLHTCQACLVHGRGGQGGPCAWCVQTARCQGRDQALGGRAGRCGGEAPVGQAGWWGRKVQEVTAPGECRGRDRRPGITLLRHLPPVDVLRPDSVEVLNQSSAELRYNQEFTGALDLLPHGPATTFLSGFIHAPQGGAARGLVLEAKAANASLWLSPNEGQQGLELVATVGTGQGKEKAKARRPGGEVLFTRGGRQLVRAEASVVPVSAGHQAGHVSLTWQGQEQAGEQHLTFRHLEPFSQGGASCRPRPTCLACLADALCGWCAPSASCLPRADSQAVCRGGAGQQQHFLVLDTGQCITCEQHIYCASCVASGQCEWLPDKAHCARRGRFPGAIDSTHRCPAPCHERSTCTSCLGAPGRCAWCSETKECFLFSVYTSVYQYGACRVWLDEDHTNVTAPPPTTAPPTTTTTTTTTTSVPTDINTRTTLPLHAPTAAPEVLLPRDGSSGDPAPATAAPTVTVPRRLALESSECHICESLHTCQQCLHTLSCGWCFNAHNPTLGVCTAGDFSRPHAGNCKDIISEFLEVATIPPDDNATEETGAIAGRGGAHWAYAKCPDVDECRLGLHDCHPNATCVNDDPGYNCTCNQGFEGNGRDTCDRTCYETCIHGFCSGAPQYRCDCKLGWTGVDCGVDCGCHNHSTCDLHGMGTCDECRDWTTGEHCHLCKPGSYGNATTTDGCQVCRCNGHFDEAEGQCHRATGKCFCLHNTAGHNCHLCQPGYFGDPRDGGHCYRECGARTVLSGARAGHLGAQVGGPDTPTSCLWVITPDDSFPPAEDLPVAPPPGTRVIQLTIEETNVACGQGSVYIFDGLPDFISRPDTQYTQHSHMVGAFCSGQATFPATVEATSGIMAVYYERNGSQQGFNASYDVLRCPDNPGPRRVCRKGRPECSQEWRGVLCDLPVCPGGCGQGTCMLQYGRCNCSQGYVGEDCGQEHHDYQVVVSQLLGAEQVGPGDPHLATVLQRLGHSLVVDQVGSLWVFGGLSLSRGPLFDVQRFDPHNNTSIWQQVTVTLQPGGGKQSSPARYLHAAAYVPGRGHMYVYGGMNHTHFLGDFWCFSTESGGWTSVDTPEDLPPLAGHTLTYRGHPEAPSLVLVGGASPQYGFLETPWEFNLATGRWARLETSGAVPVGVYGHSTVYHQDTGTFYVYGGHSFKVHRVDSFPDLYALDYARRRWSLLPPKGNTKEHSPSPPVPRAFHAAVTTPQYMVVLGGHVAGSSASAQGLVAYSYACNMWVPLAAPFASLVGPLFTPHVATAAAAAATTPPAIYLFGGYNGTARGSLLEVQLPPDLCALNANQTQCQSVIGCANCVVYGAINASFCYSNSGEEPALCRSPAGKKKSVVGVRCDAQSQQDHGCGHHESCSECLGEWPTHPDSEQRCQWCHSLSKGHCVPRGAECPKEELCQAGGAGSGCYSVTEADQCQEGGCVASDCDKCHGPRACIWTRQVRRRKQLGHYDLEEKPSLNWNCVNTTIQQHLSYQVESSPPVSCPERCHQHTSCHACLDATGAEGGWHECRWSPSLEECISPSYVPLRCLGGACGLVLAGGPEQCLPPCSTFTQCSQCLAQPRCGWCALPSPVGGLGRCVKGHLQGPEEGHCGDLDYSDLLSNTSLTSLHGLQPLDQSRPEIPEATWHYLSCPPEDECLNGHHACRPASQSCRDLPEGYHCVCAQGYNMTRPGQCDPLCSQGCLRGTCVKPDRCACHFGYVGANCSTECQCNGHSDCAGPDQLDRCLKCHNNTMGAKCDLCLPFFVGDPSRGVPCVSCRQHCHGHATTCVSPEQVSGGNTSLGGEGPLEVMDPLSPGPRGDAVCLHCANNTFGNRCETCLSGYFRGGEDLERGCRPCQCNGHGSKCNTVWGTECDCANNTETDKQCSEAGKGRGGTGEREEDCWQHQCAKCADTYLGSPSGGHQCYLQMNVDKDYCLDPKGQSQCTSGPAPLPPERTVFFAVQPKFMNVDIRLVLDVTEGGADVFFSSRGDAFVVAPPRPGASPALTLDPRYRHAKLTSAAHTGGVVEAAGRGGGGGGGNTSAVVYQLVEREGRGLKTFATVTRASEILVVRNVTNRLVVTLPQHHHDLRSAKFYLAVHGVGRPGRPHTWGSVFFRQDQPRIDLFVFFSVFFSCFFLFLAVCVVVWKVKQGLDLRRLRRRHMVEMLHMAKRPCAATTLLLHADDASLDAPETPLDNTLWSPGRRKRAAKRERGGEGLQVGPLAVEPTDDGVAAVLTLMVQLPGGGLGGEPAHPHAPTHRLALGSSLCLMSRIFPPASRPFHLRRRTSHLAS